MTEEEDTIHPVVRLLVARMESHPEEFFFDEYWSRPHSEPMPEEDRWDTIVENVRRWASAEELKLLNKPFLDAAHRATLDELLNGPERREKERRRREEEHKLWQQQMMAQSRTPPPGVLSSYQQYQNALGQNALGQNAFAGAKHNPFTDTWETRDGMRIPSESIKDSGLVGSMKKMLGLK